MEPVRWGLLSTANINRRLIPAIRAAQDCQLSAVASRGMDRAREYAAQWQIPHAYGSYEEMLESDVIDAVYISLPNHMHADWAIRAMQAGKHVLCEKPFATRVEDVDRAFAAAKQYGKVLQEAFMYRHHPRNRKVAELVHSGQLGEVRLIQSTFSFFMSPEGRKGNVRLVPEYGGGSLWDVGIYPISYVRLLYGGLPQAVTAQQWIGDTGVDEVFAGQLHYADGRTAQIACGFSIPYFTELEVHGSKGRLTLTRPFTDINEPGHELIFTTAEGRQERIETPMIDAYQGEVENMNAAIRAGQPTLVTYAETRDHIRLALALYEAARTGKMVNLL